jgi:hypothetical protein
VLVSYSDGLNEHEPEDPAFVPNAEVTYGHLIDDGDFYVARGDLSNSCEYPRRCVAGSRRVVREYAVNDGQGGTRRFGLKYRDARQDRLHGFLGFGERIVTDLDTNAGTATFYDNETKVTVGTRDVYPYANQVKSQWRWAPALAHESQPSRVEMVFADSTIDVVPTNGGQSYFTLTKKRRTRRMQGTFPIGTSMEAWVANVAANENAPHVS